MRAYTTAIFLASILWGATASAEDIVPWQTDLNSAKQMAKEQNKPLLLHFWTPTCGPCLKLDKNVFSKQSVANTLGDYFIPVKINAAARPSIRATYDVQQFPTDVIVLPNDQVVKKMVTPQRPDNYIHQLTAIASSIGLVAKKPDTDRYNTGTRYDESPYNRDAPQSNTASNSYNNVQRYNESPNVAAAAHETGRHATAPNGSGLPENFSYTKSNLPSDPSKPVGPDDRFDRMREQFGKYVGDEVITTRQQQPNSRSAEGNAGGNRQGVVMNPYVGESRANGPNPERAKTITNQFARANQNPVQPPAEQKRSPVRNQFAGQSVSKAPAAMDGYCPVTLLTREEWKKGNPQFGAIHRGRLFLFTGEKQKRAFLADPDKYSPVLAGVDPIELTEHGRVVEGHRAHGVVFRDQVYLFASEGNLETFWNKPERYTTRILQAMQTTGSDTIMR